MSRFLAFGAAAVVAAFLGGTAGYLYWKQGDQAADPLAKCREGQVGGATIGGPFTLLDKAGQAITDKEVITRPTLVYFGYTFCPDVCPFDMSRNVEAISLLEEQGHDVGLVFVTIDPERDTPEVVGDYASNLDTRVIGLSGSKEQIKAAADAYRVYYKAQAAEDGYYLVDHTAFTYLMLPGIGFADFYKREASPEQIANGAACMIDAAAG
ncbi:SCO family protein [Pseudogemmobacter faecipullorum]|uniref:SCO family protein n=1 Tax=Pseudogemmobacter faecipullorum TaxID=2755041 RepID=A0ABS8CHB7_9RHOB|nr:SCO family protein [Pseudogemmobacter faecipullorum]MCB5408761.1 SCO family protein [Pseudogemmobacter faecipullorum]